MLLIGLFSWSSYLRNLVFPSFYIHVSSIYPTWEQIGKVSYQSCCIPCTNIMKNGINGKDPVATLTLNSWLSVEHKGTWGQKNAFMSETHFHMWGRVQEIESMTPKCTPTLGITLMWESWIIKALVEEAKKHQLGFQDTIGRSWSVND